MAENLRNQDGIGEKEILVVSFGTTYADAREKCIGALEDAAERAMPEWSVRRAFTSGMVLKRLRERDGIQIDGVPEAMERARRNGVKQLVIAPTHLMDGKEYQKLCRLVREMESAFAQVRIADPLVYTREDQTALLQAIYQELSGLVPAGRKEEYALVLMGHGTDAESDRIYTQLQDMAVKLGYDNLYIATVEGARTLEDVMEPLKNSGRKYVLMAPLMVVAGDHAQNDMAGDAEDSWKNRLIGEGFCVTPVLKGLGEWPGVREMFVRHLQ